jgi:hypothetical protein
MAKQVGYPLVRHSSDDFRCSSLTICQRRRTVFFACINIVLEAGKFTNTQVSALPLPVSALCGFFLWLFWIRGVLAKFCVAFDERCGTKFHMAW